MSFFKTIYMHIMHKQDMRRKNINNIYDKQIFYIIRFNKKEGLLSMFFKAMAYIDYAEKMHYIPIVDMKNYPTMYTKHNENAWEYFFNQPYNAEVNLEDIYRYKNYIVSGFEDNPNVFTNSLWGNYFACNYNNNKKKKEFINSRITISGEVQKLLNNEQNKININNMLGVYIRGTDYVALKPSGHPIQPQFEEIVHKIKEFLLKYSDIKGIYLVTEDIDLYTRFKKLYKEFLVISFEENLIQQSKKEYLYHTLRQQDSINQGIKYLTKILLLSKCRYLITSITNGSVCALAFNGDEYKDRYIFDLGLYE